MLEGALSYVAPHMIKWVGLSCSKLTMSLVNVSLKLWSLNMAYTLIWLLKNVSSFSHFFSKNTCEFGIVLTITVNILTTNELVKLTTLWTTGPRSLRDMFVIGKLDTGVAAALVRACMKAVKCLPVFRYSAHIITDWCHKGLLSAYYTCKKRVPLKALLEYHSKRC